MKTKNVRTTWAALLTAALLLVPATSWGQTTQRGVVVGSEKVTAVQDGTNAAVTSENYTEGTAGNNGTRRVDATQGNTVTVTVADADDHTAATPKVAKVIVTQTNVKAETITVTSAGDATEMNGNATLQMSASLSPTYTDNKTVTWSVAPAEGSSATATINATTGLLTAGTTQGNVVVTATATNGTDDTSDDVTATKTIAITTIQLTAAMIQNISAMTYTGSQLKPTVTVQDGSKTLTLNTDYTVSYGANVNAGTGSVTVTGKGAYVGSQTKNFTINKANQNPTISITDIGFKAQITITGNTWIKNTSKITLYGFYGGVSHLLNDVSWSSNGNGEYSCEPGKCTWYQFYITGDNNWNDYQSGEMYFQE